MNRRTLSRCLGLGTLVALAWPATVLAQGGPTRVDVAQVLSKENVSAEQTFVGTVMPLRVSTVGSAAPGRVEEFLVNEGDPVTKGAPLARLRTRLIQAEVDAAKAELAARQSELEEMEAALPLEKEQAQARLELAQAILDLRRAILRRTETAGRGASPQDLEQALSLSKQGEAASREAEVSLKLTNTRKEKVEFLRAKRDAAQAELERLSEQLDRHTIVAPFDGYITAEHTEAGAWVMQGDPVATVAELKEVDIEVGVLEDYIGYLSLGTTANVEIAALPDRFITGKVQLIVPQANPRTRTFPVKVRVPNEEKGKTVLLKAGMFARVKLPVGKAEKALMVSKDALVLDGPRRSVFAVAPESIKSMSPPPGSPEGLTWWEGEVLPVPVTLGVAEEKLVQVKGGIAPGQRVVIQGNERLRPGQKVFWSEQDSNK